MIDSIAALFRSDFENTGSDLRRRSSLFFGISGGLRQLAKRFGIAVVVTNQVVDLIGDGDVSFGSLGNGLMDYWTRIIARMRSLVKSEMPLGCCCNK